MSDPVRAGKAVEISHTEVKLLFPNTDEGHQHRRYAEQAYETLGYRTQMISMHPMGIELIMRRPSAPT